MKGLNKLALATAVAAAPFASQAMEPMSESEMGNTTGQAGVTIELDTQMTIDQVQYSQGNTGSFVLNDVGVKGVGGADEGLDLAINVDLANSDGSDNLTSYNEKIPTINEAITGLNQVLDGNGDPTGETKLDDLQLIDTPDLNDGDALISLQSLNEGEPVDMNVSVGSAGLEASGSDNSATLISGVDMDMYISQLDIIARADNVIDNNFDGNGSLEIDTAFTIDNLDATFDVAAVELQGMRLAGANTLELLKSDQTTGASVDPTAGGLTPAVVSMDIGSGESLSGNVGESLRVNLDTFQADIWMPTINIGNADAGDASTASIGSVGISNLQVSNTEVAIYGRD